MTCAGISLSQTSISRHHNHVTVNIVCLVPLRGGISRSIISADSVEICEEGAQTREPFDVRVKNLLLEYKLWKFDARRMLLCM